jgi:hypothetical protein
MAKKRASGKRKGLDDYGQPVDLSKDAAKSYRHAWDSRVRLGDELSRIRKPTAADRHEYMAEIKRHDRNRADIKLNKTTFNRGRGLENRVTQPISLPPAKSNPLAGRTAEFGTRSVLEGMRSFMRGGGGSRLSGK